MTELSPADALAIYRTIAQYCRAVDRLDWAGIRSVYAADGIDHHTGFNGTADEYVAWLRTKLTNFTGTMHILGTHLADPISETEVISETYGQAVHWGQPADDAGLNFTSGFRYVDHFRKVDGQWLIAERFAVREWTRVDAGRTVQPEGPGPRGTRDATDPLAVLRKRLTSR